MGCSPRQRWNWTWQVSPEMEPNLTLRALQPFWLKVHIGLLLSSRLWLFYFFHVAIHGTLTQLRLKILLSPLCYFEGPRNKYLLAAHRLFKTYAAGRKNSKKNNSRSASFFLSSDLCSWVEEQEENQQQVEHTCWKLVALQGLLTETEPTQGQRVPLSHWPPAFSR